MHKILYIQYTNPAGYPPLQHSSRILADAGWQVLFLGTGAYGANALRFPPHANITVRQIPFCPAGWRQKVHYLRYALWVLFWTICWRPQWIYASDLLSSPVAVATSYLPGVRLIYHEHDSPGGAQGSRFQRLCMKARSLVARRAAACILPNQGRLERFTTETGLTANLLCVWNCPSRLEVLPSKNRTPANGLRLVYHGSIVPDRLPTTILHAMVRLPATVTLRIIGYETVGHRGYIGWLLSEADRLGIADRVQTLGPVPRRKLFGVSDGDVGLALMPTRSDDINFQYMTGASNKPFDYLACGMALLVSDLAEWRELYVTPGYARACDPANIESIAAALRWFLENPDQRHEMGERGRRRILADWNYESQFLPVIDGIIERRK
jgi:glycosyltransferase involved in cell wall biosynthesis